MVDEYPCAKLQQPPPTNVIVPDAVLLLPNTVE
jgi:hypothetical protein